jgi:hypothetical protein
VQHANRRLRRHNLYFRLWLEALQRKTPVPYGDQALTVSTHMLDDALGYQRAAVTKALDPQHIRPSILIADAVGLGKPLEIGMILAEGVRPLCSAGGWEARRRRCEPSRLRPSSEQWTAR